MRRWRIWNDDGSSSLEFITIGVLLLVPMVYLVLAVSSVQAATLATEGAARQAARVYVLAETDAAAASAAQRAIAFALADDGLDAGAAEIRIDCAPNPGTCLTRRGTVTVTVRVEVALPLVPDALNFRTSASVPVQARAAQQVSRFWGAEW